MSNLNVTYADLVSVASHLRLGKEDMNTKLIELGSLVDGLVQAGFQTDHASVAYDETFTTFQTGTKTAIDALESLANFLDQAANAMEQTDIELSNSIKA